MRDETATCEAAPITAAGLGGLAGVRHGFFGRRGGVSDGLYASLNCGFGSHDEPAAVAENRRRVAVALQAEPARLVTLYQCHSAEAAILDAPPPQGAIIRADAVVTREPGLVAAILTADCAPVLIADAEARAVAAIHAGWRGALGGVLENAVAALESLGARRDRMLAAIGPCILQPSYEVGEDFRQAFLAAAPDNAAFFVLSPETGRPHFDLPGYIGARLRAAGVAAIESIPLCTCENESIFYSYRRATRLKQPDYGRQISAILLA